MGSQEVNYVDTFQKLADMPDEKRRIERADKLVAVPVFDFDSTQGIVEFTAYEGPIGVSPLIYDPNTTKGEVQPLEGESVLATVTFGRIDIKKRLAVVQYNLRGAKAGEIALVLEESGRAIGLGDLFTVDLTPQGDKSLIEAIEQYERIRQASLKLVEPNIDWADNKNNMSAIAQASNGRAVETVVTASTGQSLAKNDGLVQVIKDMIREGVNNLKAASVRGTRQNETAETSTSLANHTQHQRIRVDVDSSGHPDEEEVRENAERFLDSASGKK